MVRLHPKFGNNKVRAAVLDVHSPLYLREDATTPEGGDIASLRALADKALDAGFTGVQLNPINDSGDNPSPYWAAGLFSYDPALVALKDIPKLKGDPQYKELVKRKRTQLKRSKDPTRFDHNLERTYNLEALHIAWRKTLAIKKYDSERKTLTAYIESCNRHVLNYAVFTVLKQHFQGQPWWEWPKQFKNRNGPAIMTELEKNKDELTEEIQFTLFTQWILEQQWTALARYLEERGAFLVIDKPIYPQHDSADVWGNRDLFYMNDDGTLPYVSGTATPGDPFGDQVWGHPVYRFNDNPVTSKAVIAFTVEHVRHIAKVARVIRLDHTLALIWKYYLVANEPGRESLHVEALKHRLLEPLRREFPDVYFIAEDVGSSRKDIVDEPLRKLGLPGIRCPIWASSNKPIPSSSRYADPHTYPPFSVALTDNHDTEALTVWWDALREENRRYFLRVMYGKDWRAHEDKPFNVLQFIKTIFASPSEIAVTTLRAVLKDTQRRYNRPGTSGDENWSLLSPKTVEEIDLRPIEKIIKETGRSS